MFTPKIVTTLTLGAFIVGCLAFQPAQKRGARGIACVDVAVNSPFPFQQQLFGQIQDEALRKSALQYYLFLDQVEARALSSRAGVMSSYGVPNFQVSTASLFAPPSIINFDPSVNAFGATGHLWGDISILGRQSPAASNLRANTINSPILNGPMVNFPSQPAKIPNSNLIGARLAYGFRTQNPPFIQIGSR